MSISVMNMPRRTASSLQIFLILLLVSAVGLVRAQAPRPKSPATMTMPSVDKLPIHAEMPDPMILANGKRVTTRAQWTKHRAEMKRVIEYYAVGRMPPPPGNVRGHTRLSQAVMDGKAHFTLTHLTFGPHASLGFDIAVFMPSGTGPFPTIVHPAFTPTPGTSPDADPESVAKSFAFLLGRGYAILTYDYRTTAADTPDTRKAGFFRAYPEYDWGAAGAWAWGMSRCVDYLETQAWVDKTKIIAVGHSRVGKATLIAGAFDERFAVVAPAGAGCFGTSAYRFSGKTRSGKEGLEEYTARFPYQVGPRLAEFSGQVEKLPFDQHWLIALVAPRAFIAADASEDPYCSEQALLQSVGGAKPVFAFLGVPGRLSVHIRPGGHALAPEDWAAILDFADAQMHRLP